MKADADTALSTTAALLSLGSRAEFAHQAPPAVKHSGTQESTSQRASRFSKFSGGKQVPIHP